MTTKSFMVTQYSFRTELVAEEFI